MRISIVVLPILTGVCGMALGAIAERSLNRPAATIPPEPAPTIERLPLDKPQLVVAVLERLDVPRRYDESVATKLTQVNRPPLEAEKTRRLRSLWIRELGWERVKGSFIRHYSDAFTDAELNGVLWRLDQPSMTKLMAEEARTLDATAAERGELFEAFWIRWNAGEILLPP